MWIAAHDGEAPPWSRDVPTVTLGPAGAGKERGLFIAVGRPGVDHDAVEFFAGRRLPDAAPGQRRQRRADSRRGRRSDRRQDFGGKLVLTRLHGGHVVDPATGTDKVADVWFENGRIVAPDGRPADSDIDGSPAMWSWPAPSTFTPTSPAAM